MSESRELEGTLTPRECALRIRRGDEIAYRTLFEEEYEPLCRFVRSYVGWIGVAEDLVQEVFLDLWRRRSDLNPDRSIRAYIYRAARNQALKHLRRQRVRRDREGQMGDGAASEGRPHEALRDKELAAAAASILDELPERRRLIFTLSRRHGLTYREIAAVLDISVNTVETQMGRALRYLRKQLRPLLSLFL